MTEIKKRLHLGCGADYKDPKKGWINLDLGDTNIYGKKIKVDIVHDLNKYPYPFKKNTFNEVLGIGILEHMDDLEKHIKELARICKQDAKIYLSVPYFTSYFAYRELYTHKFSLNSIQLFDIFRRNGIKLVSKKLGNNNRSLRWLERIINKNESMQNFYERFLSGIFPVSRIDWEFRVVKE